MKLLVIIDMQPEFPASLCEKTISGVKNKIRQFKKKNWPIIILEYDGFGFTHDDITELVEDYPKCWTLIKDQNSGAGEIRRFIIRWETVPSEIQVAGVNSAYCVKDTAFDLSHNYYYNVSVVRKACNCDTFGRTDDWYEPVLGFSLR